MCNVSMRADASCDGARGLGFRGGHPLRGGRPAGATCASAWLPVYTSAPRCAFTRVAGWGGDVHARGLDASEYRVAREVGQHAKARFKGSISHLEKSKARILNYPTMGESDGASLRWMGDA